MPLLQQRDQLEEAERVLRAPADVESVASQRPYPATHRQQGIHEVLRIQHVAHLAAISEQDQRRTGSSPDEEVSHPSLILIAELMRAIDAAHTEHHRRYSEGARVVEHILIGGSLGASIRAVEIQRLRLSDPSLPYLVCDRHIAPSFSLELEAAEPTIDLVRGGEDDRRR